MARGLVHILARFGGEIGAIAHEIVRDRKPQPPEIRQELKLHVRLGRALSAASINSIASGSFWRCNSWLEGAGNSSQIAEYAN